MGLFNKKEEKSKSESMIYDMPTSFLSHPRNPLFPKLEKLIRQAEEHHSAGDKDLCYDILGLIWRTVDKSKPEKEQTDYFKSFLDDSKVPETPNRDTNDTNVNV